MANATGVGGSGAGVGLTDKPFLEEYTRSFSSFSGANIVATFNGRHIAELQGITYSITREKGPINK